MKLVLQTASAIETMEAGSRLSSLLRGGDLVCLEGELGAGKTCFVRGVARGLGVYNSGGVYL